MNSVLFIDLVSSNFRAIMVSPSMSFILVNCTDLQQPALGILDLALDD